MSRTVRRLVTLVLAVIGLLSVSAYVFGLTVIGVLAVSAFVFTQGGDAPPANADPAVEEVQFGDPPSNHRTSAWVGV